MIKEISFLDFFSTFLDSISGMYRHLDNVLAGVNILPFGRIKYPGTISWSQGRITGGAERRQ